MAGHTYQPQPHSVCKPRLVKLNTLGRVARPWERAPDHQGERRKGDDTNERRSPLEARTNHGSTHAAMESRFYRLPSQAVPGPPYNAEAAAIGCETLRGLDGVDPEHLQCVAVDAVLLGAVLRQEGAHARLGLA